MWRTADGQPFEALTARELEVLRLMARGAGDAAIASELVVSLATAKWHAAHIRAKLGAKSRTQAILRAQELGGQPYATVGPRRHGPAPRCLSRPAAPSPRPSSRGARGRETIPANHPFGWRPCAPGAPRISS